MERMAKKLLAAALSAPLLLGLFPAPALAEEVPVPPAAAMVQEAPVEPSALTEASPAAEEPDIPEEPDTPEEAAWESDDAAAVLLDAAFASGSGTEADPFLIETEAQFRSFAEAVNSGNAFRGQFISLGADLFLSGVFLDEDGEELPWTPLGSGTSVTAFQGTFDGGGHNLIGLTITDSQPGGASLGLFASLRSAVVKNLLLSSVNLDVSGSGLLAGSIAGSADGGSVIDNCTVDGTILLSDGTAGGILGSLIQGAVVNSVSAVEVTASTAGGIAGTCSGLIANSASQGPVSGSARVGGIAGELSGSVYNVYAAGTVSSGRPIFGTASGQGDRLALYCDQRAFPSQTQAQAADTSAVDFALTMDDALQGLEQALPDLAESQGLPAVPQVCTWIFTNAAVPTGDPPEYVYAPVNLPYPVFYGEASGGFDTVTSSTGKRAAYFWDSSYQGNLSPAYGSGTVIRGVKVPVRMLEEQSLRFSGASASQDYHCYEEESVETAPALWLPLLGFDGGTPVLGEIAGTSTVLSGAEVSLECGSRHGDYLLTVSKDGGVLTQADPGSFAVYGADLTTQEGGVYHLRHLENLYYRFFEEIAFCTVSPVTGKGLAVHPEYFQNLEGQTLTGITYYTSGGVYEIPANVKVEEPKLAYALMNIPYADFFAAELDADAALEDAANAPPVEIDPNLLQGIYRMETGEIAGVRYPVLVDDYSLLNAGPEVTSQTALATAPDYAWYRPTEAPACYKPLSVSGGTYTFGAVSARAKRIFGGSGEAVIGGQYRDVEITLEGIAGLENTTISAVVITDSGGVKYPLRHEKSLWSATQMGWDLTEINLSGKSITNVRYYTPEAVLDFPMTITFGEPSYVLMNIPYADFYQSEGAEVDAATSATLRYQNQDLAKGAYHLNNSRDGSTAVMAGVIYPVLVPDLGMLNAGLEITDTSSRTVWLEVGIRPEDGIKRVESRLTGQDLLFASPSYSWYRLSEIPARYKTFSVTPSRDFRFGPVSGTAATVRGVTGTSEALTPNGNDIEITLTGTGIGGDATVSGVIATFDNGMKLGLVHVAGIWQRTQIGFADGENLRGRTITNLRYITPEGVTDYPVSIPLTQSGYVLMNIPYEAFYAAEGSGMAVDAVTAPTMKFQDPDLARGSYHSSDAESGADCTVDGVIYPVLVGDLSVLDPDLQIRDSDRASIHVPGLSSTVRLVGQEVLFTSPSYAWYALEEVPARYKTLSIGSRGFAFGPVLGTAELAQARTQVQTLTENGNDIEITLTGTGLDEEDTVSGVVLTFSDGTSLGLPHVAGIWQGTRIGFADVTAYAGKTITQIRLFTPERVVDCSVSISLTKAAYVLMNIPYAPFYAAEGGETSVTVDAVTSSTLRFLDPAAAAGSYHAADASTAAECTVNGVIYPVLVQNLADLNASLEVLPTDTKTVHTVSGTGKTLSQTQLSGQNILFCSPSYSWYRLEEVPVQYKEVNVTAVGSQKRLSFGPILGGETETVLDAEASALYGQSGYDLALSLDEAGLNDGETVSGVIVTIHTVTGTGTNAVAAEQKLGLIHVAGIWNRTNLGMTSLQTLLSGTSEASVTNIRFLTRERILDCPVYLNVKTLLAGTQSAEFTDLSTLRITSQSPRLAGFRNPMLSITYDAGSGIRTLLEDYAVTLSGTTATIHLPVSIVRGQVYTVTVSSDNYSDLVLENVAYNPTRILTLRLPDGSTIDAQAPNAPGAGLCCASYNSAGKFLGFSIVRNDTASALSGAAYVKIMAVDATWNPKAPATVVSLTE